MDAIFGRENFRNEIVWCYYRARPGGKQFARLSETIFWYSKSDKWTFNKHLMQVPLTKEALKSNRIVRKDGSVWERKRSTKDMPNWWTDCTMPSASKERCKDWTTQKPLKLYTRLVKACTKPDDLVIDPFCGCSTTLIAAENAGCEWIGMDINPDRIALLNEQFEKLAIQDLWKGKVHIKEIKSKRDLPKRKDNRPPKKKMEDFKTELLKKQRKFEGQHHYYHYCAICKNPFSEEYLEIDHIYPKAEGGEWIPKNLQLLCSRCNRRKGSTKTNEQVEKELRAEGLLFHQRAAVHAYTGIPAEEYLKREESQEEENPKSEPRRKQKEDLKRKGASRQINIVL